MTSARFLLETSDRKLIGRVVDKFDHKEKIKLFGVKWRVVQLISKPYQGIAQITVELEQVRKR